MRLLQSEASIVLAVLLALVLLVLVLPMVGWGTTGPWSCTYWPGT